MHCLYVADLDRACVIRCRMHEAQSRNKQATAWGSSLSGAVLGRRVSRLSLCCCVTRTLPLPRLTAYVDSVRCQPVCRHPSQTATPPYDVTSPWTHQQRLARVRDRSLTPTRDSSNTSTGHRHCLHLAQDGRARVSEGETSTGREERWVLQRAK